MKTSTAHFKMFSKNLIAELFFSQNHKCVKLQNKSPEMRIHIMIQLMGGHLGFMFEQ